MCLGELREVVDGHVRCPQSGTRVHLGTCLDCHHLVEAWNDRDLDCPCSTGPALR